MSLKEKRIITVLMILVALTMGMGGFASDVSADVPLAYTVQWGDTLYSVAARYGVSVTALMQANSLRYPDFIYVGQRLTIPGSSVPAPLPATTYVVQPGDTLFAIAARYNTTVAALMQANRLYNYWIYVGQVLRLSAAPAPVIPAPPPVPTQGFYYTVYPGDYLALIAARYGSSVYAIAMANRLSNPSFIYAGQRLFIPGASMPIAYPALIPPPAIPIPPTAIPYPTATPMPAAIIINPPPNPVGESWEAVIITNTVGQGPCWLTAYVVGKTDWPVVVATTDGSFISDPKNTGTKPEKGPYAVEFAHSCTRTWRVIPLGLNVYADVTMNGGHAEVEFHLRTN